MSSIFSSALSSRGDDSPRPAWPGPALLYSPRPPHTYGGGYTLPPYAASRSSVSELTHDHNPCPSTRQVDDIRREMADVAAGTITGFLFDREVAQFYVAQWPGCGLRLLPQITEPFDYGLAFGPATSREIVDAFSLAIQMNMEDGTIQDRGNTYLLADSPCLAQDDQSEDIVQLSFSQVYGLWVMMGVAVGLGVFLMGGKRMHVLISRWAFVALHSLRLVLTHSCVVLVRSFFRRSGTSGAGIATGDE